MPCVVSGVCLFAETDNGSLNEPMQEDHDGG